MKIYFQPKYKSQGKENDLIYELKERSFVRDTGKYWRFVDDRGFILHVPKKDYNLVKS